MKYLLMKGGKKLTVIGETSRYWLCKGTQYRKNSKSIESVVEKAQPKPKEEKED